MRLRSLPVTWAPGVEVQGRKKQGAGSYRLKVKKKHHGAHSANRGPCSVTSYGTASNI